LFKKLFCEADFSDSVDFAAQLSRFLALGQDA
jgi:hypothetical protein